MGNLLGDEQREELVEGPLLAFCTRDELAPCTSRVGEV
jgi:hypothetical protein